MNRFFAALRAHESGVTNAFVPFFRETSMAEAVLALRLLAGEPPLLHIPFKEIQSLILQEASLPTWLVERCKEEVGDVCETFARLWPRSGRGLSPSLCDLLDAAERGLSPLFDQATDLERIFLIRLLTKKLNLHLSTGALAGILSAAFESDPILLETRLLEGLPRSPAELEALLHPPPGTDPARWHPLPFLKPRPFTGTDPGALPTLEWKWDGLRAQLLCREDKILLWSEREGLVTNRFPGIIAEAAELPLGCILDGILLPWQEEKPLPAHQLYEPGISVIFMAWDCLEIHGVDIREMPLYARRMQLLPMFGNNNLPSFRCSEELRFRDWQQASELRTQARSQGARGLVLKPGDSPYRDGFWKVWPCEMQKCRVMLLYCVQGDPPEYAFGLRQGDSYIAVVRIRGGFSGEIRELLENHVRGHSLDKQGPVRGLAPGLVFELGYEYRRPSKRHKSGWVLEGACILRWLPGQDADVFPRESGNYGNNAS